MSGRHTPGPWVMYPETDGTEICAVDMAAGLPIRQVIARPVRGENWIYNARLIASAPDLLAAARLGLELCDGLAGMSRNNAEALADEYSTRIRTAIAKAEGRE